MWEASRELLLGSCHRSAPSTAAFFLPVSSHLALPCHPDPVVQGTWQPTASQSTCSSKCLSFSVPVPTSQRKDFTYPTGASPIELEGRTLCINVAPRNAPWWAAGRGDSPCELQRHPQRLSAPASVSVAKGVSFNPD